MNSKLTGDIRRAQVYATVYQTVGFQPFYLSDFNNSVDYENQISPSMISTLHRFHLVRKTGNKREYEFVIEEWEDKKIIKKGHSFEWQLEFNSHIISIMNELGKLCELLSKAQKEASNLVN